MEIIKDYSKNIDSKKFSPYLVQVESANEDLITRKDNNNNNSSNSNSTNNSGKNSKNTSNNNSYNNSFSGSMLK